MTEVVVPASSSDGSVELAILQRVQRPFIPQDVPEEIASAIIDLEVGASLEDQDKVRKAWADHKVAAAAELAAAQQEVLLTAPTDPQS